jgi:hypothetical protein
LSIKPFQLNSTALKSLLPSPNFIGAGFVIAIYLFYICKQNDSTMETAIKKKATMFRLNVDLIERLKEMAKREHRSLNNFVECVLLDVAYNEPNEVTKSAIEEAKSGKLHNVPPVDTTSVEAMFKSMGL